MTLERHPQLDEDEISEVFIRASGPGGQNVNKVSTAVELRFDVRASRSLSEPARIRLLQLAGRRMTKDGVLVIKADRFRTREQNRADARARLLDLVARAWETPKPRVKTRPTKASKERRHSDKQHRRSVKQGRAKPVTD